MVSPLSFPFEGLCFLPERFFFLTQCTQKTYVVESIPILLVKEKVKLLYYSSQYMTEEIQIWVPLTLKPMGYPPITS